MGGVVGYLLIEDDDLDSDDASAPVTTSSSTSTSTTLVEPAATAPVTTATTVAATTTTTRATTTTSKVTTSTSTPASTVPPTTCGSGRASVSFVAKELVTDALSSSFIPEAVVENKVTAAIEVEEVSLEVVYPGGEVRSVRFATAGTVIAPGTSASFTADRLTTAKRYESVRFTRFTYFTQGQPTDCRVTTP